MREASVAARVSLSTLIDYLWRIVTDPTTQQKRKDQAVLQLSRILTVGDVAQKPPPAIAGRGRSSEGLDDPLIGSIEERILGVRRAPPELPEEGEDP